MSEKSPSKDEALEALDFIVNVLKEHEKDLDKLVSELGTVAGQLGESGELSGKVKKIEDKLNGVQNDVSNIVKSFTASPREASPTANIIAVSKDRKPEAINSSSTGNLPLLFQCKQWEDFQALAAQSQTVSFVVKDSEKNIQVNALKSNQVVAYNGEIPKLSLLVKAYLSKLLDLPEGKILEGEITLL
jgi:hypothetical protein